MIIALDKCQKSLTDYLNSKRAVFPRFTFLSDDELLNILGSGVPIAIQEHVGKMFDNLDKFRFELSETEREIVTALISAEEEVMEFRNVVLAEGNIEEWMVFALEEMKRSNRFLTKKAVFNYGKVRRKYLIRDVNKVFFFLSLSLYLFVGEETKNGMDARLSREYGPVR